FTPSIRSYVTRPTPSSTLFPYTPLFRPAPRGSLPCLSRRHPSSHPSNPASSRPFTLAYGARNHEPSLRDQREWVQDRERARRGRSEEHTSELQSRENLVCRLLLEKKKNE